MAALKATAWLHPPGIRWVRRLPAREKVLYLTFDDGPIPELTPWVLDTLRDLGVQATFFCIGRHIAQHPEIYTRIRAEGHGVGNHTETHVNGWHTSCSEYVRDTLQCQARTGNRLFRPPYGRITLPQAWALRQHFELVFWDVLTGDFDSRLSPEHVLQDTIRRARSGSILVFHDNLLSEERMRYAFPRTVKHFLKQGYRFPPLPGSTTGMPASRQAPMPPSSSHS
ncbi:MAG: polysaccharide deacetylase family protein [Flavobacteriales bacterium]|nr:polysaccharide deacetylase family protein [Flavobacteriales bacterium]